MNNMEEQFVTYEIALALKELGFNEECLGFYKISLGNNIPELIIIKCNYNSGKYITIPEDFHIDAPLWQQVIDWFRTKYNISIVIMPCIIPSNELKYYIFKGKLKWDWHELYNTYEEAREQAILKVIEIIKNKKQWENN